MCLNIPKLLHGKSCFYLQGADLTALLRNKLMLGGSVRLDRRVIRLVYRMILSVLEPRKCEYLKDYSLDFEHAYMTTYLAS